MYKHILIPTDGSTLSEEAASSGIELARRLGARATVLHVLAGKVTFPLDAWTHQDAHYAEHLARALERHGGLYVDTIRELARCAGVRCEAVLVRADAAAEAILAEAKKRECDLIVMASHGRRGADGLLLASVTVAVVTLGRIPVLVHHGAKVTTAHSAAPQPAMA